MRRTEELVRQSAREKIKMLEEEFFEQAALEIQKEIFFECYMTVAPKQVRDNFDPLISQIVESANEKLRTKIEITPETFTKHQLLADIKEIVEAELNSFRKAVDNVKRIK